MPTNTNVTNLKINELTKAQFETAVQGGVIGANELSLITDMSDTVQVETMPTASVDELGNIYQFVGTTDANYTHGYFYECVSDGQQPATYSWSNIQVQASSGGLPTQTGNAGKFLITDGTDASWGDTVNHITVSKSADSSVLDILGNTLVSPTIFQLYCWDVSNTKPRIQFYWKNTTLSSSIAFKEKSILPSSGIMLGDSSNFFANVYTNKINNGSDITVPTVAGSMAVQVSSMPTADSTLEGQIYQFVGTTDSTYTNGHFYKCVSDGQATPTYSWTEVQLGGGGSSYTAGTGIDITSGVISVTAPTLQNTATGSNSITIGGVVSDSSNNVNVGGSSEAYMNAVGVGQHAVAGGNGSIAIGQNSRSSTTETIAIGNAAQATASSAIQLGYGTNSVANTFKVKSYEMMSADGTIPTARLTKVNSTITLTAAGWSSNTQTVNVTGMTATGVVMVSPDPTDQSAYTSAGILCTAQAAGTLTFTCSSVPSADIDVNVVML